MLSARDLALEAHHDDNTTAPLLANHSHSGVRIDPSAHPSSAVPAPSGGPSRQEPSSGKQGPDRAAVDLGFLRSFWRLLGPLRRVPDPPLIRPYSALLLVVLSVVEALIVSKVGKVAGSFYRLVVDRELDQLTSFLAHSGFLYFLVTLLKATSVWLSEFLALRWRGALTRSLHAKYCQKKAFYWLKAEVDNPDQRVAADLANWCTTLGDLMQVFCAAPLQVVYYSWLTFSYTGPTGLAIAYSFFIVGTVLQKLIISPIANLVFRQEQFEGDFRAAHVRLHGQREEIAFFRAGQLEGAALDDSLSTVLYNAGKIVARHWLLETCTKGLEYIGALLNYVAVALVVFGAATTEEEHDSGKDAELVSNASFATLTLIYAFTQLLDTAEKVSNIAGYTARVSQLIDELDAIQEQRPQSSPRASVDGAEPMGQAAGRPVIAPGELATASRTSFEVSVHQPGQDIVSQLEDVFVDAPMERTKRLETPMLVVPTFQVARNGVDLGGDCSDPELVARVAAEMDRMLGRFLAWAKFVIDELEGQGHWANAVDPRTGMALDGRQAGAYSEAQGARALLGYSTVNTGVCDVINHPTHGTRIYPATLVAMAPPEALQRAARHASGLAGSDSLLAGAPSPAHLAMDSPAKSSAELKPLSRPDSPRPPPMASTAQVLVQFQGFCVDTGAGVPAVTDLNLNISPGQHLLIAGPSGCGKSTLLKAMARLWDVKAGQCKFWKEQHTMFLPQAAVLAPSLTLAAQLLYPSLTLSQSSSMTFSSSHLQWLLQAVGLEYLWDRAEGNCMAKLDWLQALSPGELQRISIARVLARRPALALLDESTSAVSLDMERKLYSLLKAAGITIISVAHRTGLRQMHSSCLHLSGDGQGTWQLERLDTQTGNSV